MMMNKIRLYSTNINVSNSQELLNSHKINASKTIYILNAIEYSDDCCHDLLRVFLSLEPDKKYKLEYCMCLYTNSKKRQFIPTYPGMSDIFNDNNKGYFIGYIKWLDELIKTNYKIRGFTNILSNSVTIKSEDNIEEFVYDTFTFIRRKIGEINKKQLEFYEFKRPLVLIVNKL